MRPVLFQPKTLFNLRFYNRPDSLFCQEMNRICPPSLLRLPFLRKSKLVARKQGRCAEKASAQLFRIPDFGFFWFSFSIRIPHLNCPPDPENEPCLMVFARNALAFGPGNGRNSIGLTNTCRKVKVGKMNRI